MALPDHTGKLILEVFLEGTSLLVRLSDSDEAESTLRTYSPQEYCADITGQTSRRIWEILQSAVTKGALEDRTQELVDAGKSLFNQLLPDETRTYIQSRSECDLVLLLDERCTHLPWELLHDGKDFLCCRFSLSRIVRTTAQAQTSRRKPGRKPVEFLIVSNPAGDLPAATEEAGHLQCIFSDEPRLGVDWYNGNLSAAELSEILPDYDAIHFCGHGIHEAGEARESGWLLRDGRFTPRTLKDYADLRIPVPFFVFNNACCSGETQAWNKDAVNACYGMADAFLRAGCRHYIGAIACISDRGGKEFAAEFYRYILSGHSVGRALQLTRVDRRADDKTDSLVWAQYVLYGIPDGSIFTRPDPQKTAPTKETSQNPSLLTIVLAEVVGVQSLLEEKGVIQANKVIQNLQGEVLEVLVAFEDGWEVCSLGYCQFFAFQRPSEAVLFSLIAATRVMNGLACFESGLAIRLGLHLGEVALEEAENGSGLQKTNQPTLEVAQHILRIAKSGQILMSRSVFDNARSVLHAHDLRALTSVVWLDHGAYRLKGCGDPVGICEVGEKLTAPLAAPEDSTLAHRYVSPDQESVLGWRPALDQSIPTSPGWVLIEKLGAGTFGEVWRGKYADTSDTRVFKFCFREDRVRALKREVALFRLLSTGVGAYSRIIQIQDIYFEEPPYYIGFEDFGGVDLARWCSERGGCTNITFETLLEVVVQAAEALQMAHDAGIIHRDVKPSNILVGGDPGNPHGIEIKLTDFGIGQIVSRDLLSPGISSGFTETFSTTEMASISGSRLYIAPEVLSGRPASTRSDIYSLGIVLYQLLIGDLTQPLAGDWREKVHDDLLAEDLGRCLAGEPTSRFQSAGQLAESLRALESRRIRAVRHYEEQCKARRRKRWLVGFLGMSAIGILLTISLGVGFWREREARLEAQALRQRAEHELYISTLGLVQKAIEAKQFERAIDLLYNCPEFERNWEWGHLIYQCNQDVMTFRGHTGQVGGLAVSPDGSWAVSGSLDSTVRVWDLAEGKEAKRLEGVKAPVRCICLSPDGHLLAAGCDNGTFLSWDTTSWGSPRSWEGYQGRVVAFAFNSNGSILATGGTDSMVKLWDVASSRLIRTLDCAKNEEPTSLAFHGASDVLAVACRVPEDIDQPRNIRLFDPYTGQEAGALIQQGNSSANCIVFSPDYHQLAIGWSDGSIGLFNPIAGEPIHTIESNGGSVWTLDYSQDGGRLAAGYADGSVIEWDISTGTPRNILRGHAGGVHSVRFLLGDQFVLTTSDDRTIKFWYVGKGGGLDVLTGLSSGVSSLAFSSDGELLCAANSFPSYVRERQASIWNTWTAERIHQLESDDHSTCCVAFSHETGRLYSGGQDSHLRIWKDRTHELIEDRNVGEKVPEGSFDDIVFISLSTKPELLAVGLRNGFVSLWQTLPLCRLTGADFTVEGEELTAMALAADGKQIVCSLSKTGFPGSGSVKMFDAVSKEIQELSRYHTQEITCLRFSPDNQHLVAGCIDGKVILSPVNGEGETVEVSGHQDRISTLAFSDDGSRLFTGSLDGVLKIWHLCGMELREILTLEGSYRGGITTVSLAASGTFLASGDGDNTIQLWPAFPWNTGPPPGTSRNLLNEPFEKYKRSFWRKRLPDAPWPSHRSSFDKGPKAMTWNTVATTKVSSGSAVSSTPSIGMTTPSITERLHLPAIGDCTDTIACFKKGNYYLCDGGDVEVNQGDRGSLSFRELSEVEAGNDLYVQWYVCWPSPGLDSSRSEPRRYTDRSKQKHRITLRNAETGRLLATDPAGNTWAIAGIPDHNDAFVWTIVSREKWEENFAGSSSMIAVRIARNPGGYLRSNPGKKGEFARIYCTTFEAGDVDEPQAYDKWDMVLY